MEVVWVIDQRCWAVVKRRAAEYIVATYSKDGIEYEEILDIHDVTEPREMGIDYETETQEERPA